MIMQVGELPRYSIAIKSCPGVVVTKLFEVGFQLSMHNGLMYVEDYAKKRTLKRKISQYETNGNFITEFESVTQASKTTGVNMSNICHNAQGKLKSAGGFIFKYT